MSGFMDCFGQTDIGRKRSTNEDQFLISDVCKSMRVHQTSLALDHQTRLFGETQGKLLVVADGMGGHEAGERASQLAIDALVDYALNRLNWFMSEGCETEAGFEEDLKQALISCQRRIDREVAAIPQRRGMGSTLTLVYIVWPKMFLVHVGDTRCYLLRDGHLQLLTRDHTLADLTESVTRSFSADHPSPVRGTSKPPRPMANLLWNVIGGDQRVPHPDASALELAIGDTLLLCSDGLTNHLEDDQIRDILTSNMATSKQCQRLIEAANQAGGSDNITVVIGRFLERADHSPLAEAVELPIDNLTADTIDFATP